MKKLFLILAMVFCASCVSAYTISWDGVSGADGYKLYYSEIGGAINMARYVKGLKSSIEVLKTMKEVQTHRSTRRTPYEGVPISVSSNEFVEQK